MGKQGEDKSYLFIYHLFLNHQDFFIQQQTTNKELISRSNPAKNIA